VPGQKIQRIKDLGLGAGRVPRKWHFDASQREFRNLDVCSDISPDFGGDPRSAAGAQDNFRQGRRL
jgi:hypothetical protein